MRTAIILAIFDSGTHLALGPVAPHEANASFKKMDAGGAKELQLWTSDAGKIKSRKFQTPAAPSQHSNPPTADREGNSPAASGETPVPSPQATTNEQAQSALLTPEGEQSSGDSGCDADVPRLPKAKKS